MTAKKLVDQDEVKRRFAQGESFGEIGKALGVTSTAIRYILLKHGLVERSEKHAPKITPKMAETIKALVAQKMIVAHIAKEVGVSATGIRAFLKKEGIEVFLAPPPDRSRPCQRCGTVFVPKYSDGTAKLKHKFCSPACVSAHVSELMTVYSEEKIREVIRLKKIFKTIEEIEKLTGVDINKIKEVTKDQDLYVPRAVATKNSQDAKTLINPNHMADMRQGHMKLSNEEFYSRMEKIEKEIVAGRGTAGGLAKKYGINPVSAQGFFRGKGKKHLLEVKESTPQREIFEFVQSLVKGKVLYNDRKLIAPLEVDIYIPDQNLAIEFCGLYWHSEKAGYRRNIHHDKMMKCREKGVRLLTIFEDEWYEKRSQVEGYLKAVLGLNPRTVFARKTEVRKLDKLTARDFLNHYHIQGAAHTEVEFGLYLGEELLAVITGAKHHRQGNASVFVLNRLAFRAEVSIPGGASRLVKALREYAKAQGYLVLRTWSDNRWSEGDVYKMVGFVNTVNHGPDYSYVKHLTRITKQSCQKALLSKQGATGSTESEMAKSLGYYRIWDCGKKTWEMPL